MNASQIRATSCSLTSQERTGEFPMLAQRLKAPIGFSEQRRV
jgi:hypothetical protein